MTTITAYAYNAALHCPRCAFRYFRVDPAKVPPGADALDGCKDREGNAPAPLFSTDANADGYCDTCDMAYGDAEPRAHVLSIDAWRGPEGWTWNSWHKRGTVPVAWCDLSPRALLRNLRAFGLDLPPGAVCVEDDGYNVEIQARGTREPLYAIAYGEACA